MLVIKVLATNTIHKAIKLQITAYSLYIFSPEIIPITPFEKKPVLINVKGTLNLKTIC
jgi:hypothetical protein